MYTVRVGGRQWYGRGVYFTTDSCKGSQNCDTGDERILILARVLLGHPFLAEGPVQSHERPLLIEGWEVPYDSTIARPGILNGKGKGKGKRKGKDKQLHWEFVVQRGDLQAYPELLITLKMRDNSTTSDTVSMKTFYRRKKAWVSL